MMMACGSTQSGTCPTNGTSGHRCDYGAPGHKLHICACGRTWT